MTSPITLRTGDPLWVVVFIDESNFVKYPRDWWQAFKAHWFPEFLLDKYPVLYSKAYRRWYLQGIYDTEEKACHACENDKWCYFPFLINVAYPKKRVEVHNVFPVRDDKECSELSAPSTYVPDR